MPVKPRLADVQCSRLQFESGDRILVKSYYKLDHEAKKKLRKTIEKWAGVSVEVLIYDATQMEITVEKGEKLGIQQ